MPDSHQVEFIRFNKPEYDDVNEEKVLKSKTRDPYLSIFPPPPGRTLALLDGSGGTSSKLSYVSVRHCTGYQTNSHAHRMACMCV